MVKESIYKTYPGLIFSETFNDEQTTRKNNGIPADVIFEDGKAIFNGSTSNINADVIYNYTGQNKVGTIRVKFNTPTSRPSANNRVFSFGNGGIGLTSYVSLVMETTGVLRFDVYKSNNLWYIKTDSPILEDNVDIVVDIVQNGGSPFMMINGVKVPQTVTKGTDAAGWLFDVPDLRNFRFGCMDYTGSNSSFGESVISYFEIYDRAFTEEELVNLYNNIWNHELITNDILIDFDATQGLIDIGNLADVAISTDVEVRKNGTNYTAIFDGITSQIDLGSPLILDKSTTTMFWLKPGDLAGYGRAINSGNFLIGVLESYSGHIHCFYARRSTSVNAYSGNYSISTDKDYFVAVTNSEGTFNFYIGDKDNSPKLSGTANQSGGSYAIASGNTFVGGKGGSHSLDGDMPLLRCVEGILSKNNIIQFWSETRKHLD